jgi:hypothetical protein
VELGITMNHHCHTPPPLPKLTVHVSTHCTAHTVRPAPMSYISAIGRSRDRAHGVTVLVMDSSE